MIWPHVIYNYMDDPFSMHYLAADDIYIYEIVILIPACLACMISLQVKMGLFSRHELATGYIYEKS